MNIGILCAYHDINHNNLARIPQLHVADISSCVLLVALFFFLLFEGRWLVVAFRRPCCMALRSRSSVQEFNPSNVMQSNRSTLGDLFQ